MTVFGANPIKLYQVGRSKYTEVSTAYAEATQKIHGASQGDAGQLGRIYSESWASLRDDMQNCLAESSDIFLDTGKALIIAAEEFGYTDDENGSKLKKFESDAIVFPKDGDPKPKRPGDPALWVYRQTRARSPTVPNPSSSWPPSCG